MKATIKILQTYAHSTGRDMQSVFTEMLDFFLDTFDTINFLNFKGDMIALFASRKEINPTMFETLEHWLRCANKSIIENGVSDFFGELYESMFLGKSKASAMGQFFTPLPLCQHMAALLQTPDARVIGEPSCGSGRNVLAHYQYADKTKLFKYRCEDLDPTSVKMCALNMMINEMYGSVVCHDSLDPNSFHFGYAINEVRYPIPSPFYSIRKISPKEYFDKQEHRFRAECLGEPPTILPTLF
ncbi:MAG: SAM-dependent methyltransferase [Muribaculaceae bacterium]|nr:SAM-dependent methyltransferase [Muribaculaceae bacterium]